MQKITPFLWFDNNAKEAVALYKSVFKDVVVHTENVFDAEGTPGPAEVLVIDFEIFGTRFSAMNAGPMFKFNEAISFVIDCDGQEEVDYYWNALTADGGEESMCGWLKDKFGLSWQVVPKQLNEALANPDPEKARAAMQNMLQMRKIVIADL